MTLRLNGSSSGHTEIKAPAAAGDNTITLPTSNGSAEQFLKNSGTAGELEFSSMVETSTGVGINQSSPSYELQVSQSGSGADIAATSDVTSGTASRFILGNSAGTARATFNLTGGDSETAYLGTEGSFDLYFQTNGAERARIDSSGMLNVKSGDLRVTGGEGLSASLYLIADEGDDNADGWRINSNQDENDLTFSNNVSGSYSDLVTIANSGDLRVGTGANNGNGKIEVFFDTSRNGIHLRPSSSVLNQNYLIFTNSAGQTTGYINNSGTTSVSYNTSSDYRLKENVVDLDGAIARVKQLAPKRFNFIGEADRTVDGFLAHEAQTVVPEAISGTHNEVDSDNNPVYQGIDQSKLVPLLTAALQEAISKIETLETKVAALEAA